MRQEARAAHPFSIHPPACARSKERRQGSSTDAQRLQKAADAGRTAVFSKVPCVHHYTSRDLLFPATCTTT